MEYIRSYKSFVHSQYLYEGVRVTIGIVTPALLMAYFGLLQTGIVLSLGAMCVSVTDAPGPIIHRRNGMLACIASIFIVSLLSGLAAFSPIVLGIALFVFCFFYSMIAVYGTRAGALGIASLLILVLNLQQQQQGWNIVTHSLYLVSGGVWYMCFSILVYNVRPYKLAQQALGDCIQSVAEYLRLRADFYKKDVDYDTTYRSLLQQQALVQEKQNMMSELLFKTRDIIKESTATGRILVMIYLDIADMFERIMTSYQDYQTLHEYFDDVAILERFHSLAVELADEIESIGIAVKSGTPIRRASASRLQKHVRETRENLDALRETHMTHDNLVGFMSLRRILENIEDITDRVKTLQQYTTYDRSISKKQINKVDYGQYISHQEITPELLVDNLTFKSESFRHSLRLSIAVIAGYLVSLFFTVGHGYWILLTIVVIIKPAYSLTKSRNKDRLLGTLAGVIIGVILVYLIPDKTALLIIMILLIAGTYIFVRKHYLTAVIMMTPYIIIFFHLLNPNNFRNVLADRVIDTVIGSVIAFAASLFLFPTWEREKIKPLMIKILEEGIRYFEAVANALVNKTDGSRQVARKNALVALANLSDAFNRMLAEPKRKQAGIEDIHHFVVLCHMLISHIATLSLFSEKNAGAYKSPEYLAVISDISLHLNSGVLAFEGETIEENSSLKKSLRALNEQVNLLLEKRQVELKDGFSDTETKRQLIQVKSVVDQLNFIFNTGLDINKTAKALVGVV
jgi:uncharacterized membrane protein (TIGR01666 family)